MTHYWSVLDLGVLDRFVKSMIVFGVPPQRVRVRACEARDRSDRSLGVKNLASSFGGIPLSSNIFSRPFARLALGRLAFSTVLLLGFAAVLLMPAQIFAQASE